MRITKNSFNLFLTSLTQFLCGTFTDGGLFMARIADKSLDTLKPLLLPNYAAKVEAGFSKVVSEGNKEFFREGRETIELGETGQFDHSSQNGRRGALLVEHCQQYFIAGLGHPYSGLQAR